MDEKLGGLASWLEGGNERGTESGERKREREGRRGVHKYKYK